MHQAEPFILLLAAIAAGMLLAKHAQASQAAAAPVADPLDGSMAWLLNYGGGFR